MWVAVLATVGVADLATVGVAILATVVVSHSSNKGFTEITRLELNSGSLHSKIIFRSISFLRALEMLARLKPVNSRSLVIEKGSPPLEIL